ncbi:nucleolar protein 58 [Episyrphus balteatus]|uniref:nucleolar protein 58 n=1 Tax=Episyrphus balteatus TaxID=286459 RepID=UPI002485DD9A|nr:nucleolar protein 58 [Episyrphus balteatus]XP_055841299.1 nucleolar protein 58 [Episyrphus balteatus]
MLKTMDLRKMSEKDIEENLKEILGKESREERKANGRLVAVVVASFVIFLAIYHAWIRKTTVLAGILVPALIMILYGGWVVILAKRDKRKRQLFEKKIEEVARAQKLHQAEIGESKRKSSKASTTSSTLKLSTKDEKDSSKDSKKTSKTSRSKKDPSTKSDSSSKTKSSKSDKSSKTSIPHRKKIKTKHPPSLRHKLCRQNAVIETPTAKIVITCKEERKKAPFVRTSSAP